MKVSTTVSFAITSKLLLLSTPSDAYQVPRRAVFAQTAAKFAMLGAAPSIAQASLLDEFGSDPQKVVQKDVVEESALTKGVTKTESIIEPSK